MVLLLPGRLDGGLRGRDPGSRPGAAGGKDCDRERPLEFLRSRTLLAALGRMLESVGTIVVFLLVNVVVGAALVFLCRSVGLFVSLYSPADVTLALVSVVQGVAFHWRGARRRKTVPFGGVPRVSAGWGRDSVKLWSADE